LFTFGPRHSKWAYLFFGANKNIPIFASFKALIRGCRGCKVNAVPWEYSVVHPQIALNKRMLYKLCNSSSTAHQSVHKSIILSTLENLRPIKPIKMGVSMWPNSINAHVYGHKIWFMWQSNERGKMQFPTNNLRHLWLCATRKSIFNLHAQRGKKYKI